MKLTQLLNIDKRVDFTCIIFFLTAPIILIGAYLATLILDITYTINLFYLVFFLILIILLLLFFVLFLMIKKESNSKIIFYIFLLLILFFSILYRYSVRDLGYNYSTLNELILKYPYFLVKTTDFSSDYEKYSRVKSYIIAFTDLKKYEKTSISVYFYSDSISQISGDTILLFSSDILKKYATKNFIEEKQLISLSKTDSISIIKSGNPINKLRVNIRKKIFENLSKNYSRWNLGSIYAVLTGSRQFMFQPLMEIFQDTGTSHLFALSGQHLSIILVIVGLFTTNPFILLFFSLLFLAFAGWQVSFLRAFYSLLLALIIKRFNIKPKFENIVSLITFLVFISEPENILSISFLLSITAIAALLSISLLLPKFHNNTMKFLFIPLLASIDIFIFQFPLIVSYFGKINLLTPFINIIAIPLFCLAIYFAVPSLIFNPGQILSNISSGFFNILYLFLLVISKIKIFIINIKFEKFFGFILLFLIYIIYFLLIRFKNNKIKEKFKMKIN